MFKVGNGTGLGQIGFGIFRLCHSLRMGHLDCHGTLQLVVVGQVDQAETTLAEYLLDPVAPDVRGGKRIGWGWLPSGLVHSLGQIVHADFPSSGWVYSAQIAVQ